MLNQRRIIGHTSEEAAQEIVYRYGSRKISYSLSNPIENGRNFIFGKRIKYTVTTDNNKPMGSLGVKKFIWGWQMDYSRINIANIKPMTDPIEAFINEK